MKTKKAVAVCLSALALIAAGCGDDDEDTTTSTTTEETTGTTGATGESGATGSLPADVAEEGNQICEEGNEALGEAFGQLGDKEPDEKFVEDVVVPNIQGQIDDLRALDDSEELQTVLDDAEDILGDIEDDPKVFFDDTAFDSINDDLRGLGLAACA